LNLTADASPPASASQGRARQARRDAAAAFAAVLELPRPGISVTVHSKRVGGISLREMGPALNLTADASPPASASQGRALQARRDAAAAFAAVLESPRPEGRHEIHGCECSDEHQAQVVLALSAQGAK